MPTQNEINVAKQRIRNLYCRVNLLNKDLVQVDSWDNVVIGEPSFSNSSDSDIRRTCSISLIPIDESFGVGYDKKIWLDKYIQIYVGIEDIHTKEIVYTNKGIYLLENPQQTYDATNNTINMTCIDLMARLTGLRCGNLEGLEHIIEAGRNVREAIIATLELGGFTKYICEECQFDVPNEMRFGVGSTIYDILKALCDIDPNMQIYFDVDGVFHYEPVPTGKDAMVQVDDTMWDKVLLGWTKSYDFDSVKNSITVLGKTHDIKKFATNVNYVANTKLYTLTIASTAYRDNLKVGFVANANSTNANARINSLAVYPIKNNDGTDVVLENGVYYVLKLHYTTPATNSWWEFYGEVTPTATIKETNDDSPFAISRIGEIREVLSGSDYDNIYTSKLAMARAKFELYHKCRVMDNIALNCLPLYYLDVNDVIEITIDGVKDKYIIKSIQTSLGVSGVQNIQAMKYYSYYDE